MLLRPELVRPFSSRTLVKPFSTFQISGPKPVCQLVYAASSARSLGACPEPRNPRYITGRQDASAGFVLVDGAVPGADGAGCGDSTQPAHGTTETPAPCTGVPDPIGDGPDA